MVESVISYLDKFGPLILEILLGFLVINSTLLLWLWFSNRKKYHNLKHAIPANVVQSYLDSIIQNSSALKSSLFRGGGSEITGIPSVLPSSQLGGGESIMISGGGSSSGASLEELNQKNALISSLEAQLSAAKNAQKALEAQIKNLQAEIAGKNARIKELEDLLAQAQANQSSGGSTGPVDENALQAELSSVSKERDELKDRLKEFEIISDDLADLKRLKQENEQLKRSLDAKGGGTASPQGSSEESISVEKVQDIFSDVNEELNSTENDISAFEDFVGGESSETNSDETSSENSSGNSEENADDSVAAQDSLNEFSGGSDSESEAMAVSGGSDQNSEIPSDELSLDQSSSGAEEAAQSGEEASAGDEAAQASEENAGEVSENKSDKTSEDLLSEFEKMLG